VLVGHHSTGWCNLANIAFQAGGAYTAAEAKRIADGSGRWDALLTEMDQLLRAHSIAINSPAIKLSPVLEFDAAVEKFVGPHADEANRYLKREYRQGFVVPENLA